MLKSAIALDHISKLESHLQSQSQKIEFIRKELIVNTMSRNARGKTSRDPGDSYTQPGQTVDTSARQVL